ncbi:TRAP transporter small permease [Fusobacterium simiae]|uniref:TRAP transporter small permease n=1 Tax=Fusobacterium simiae TaxID=855 RepID=A0ABT4DJP4_FUSSI|nr:TRAP transporter small permease [Fusobacterium simiae]MCY7008178.1 TRAP transporter small permease [Fusobacterium simiae]
MKVLRKFQKIEDIIMVITFIIMVISSFAQVINRNIFKIPISGFEEAAKYSMVYMVLLGTEMGLRDGTQISVTAVVDILKGRTKKIVMIISKLIVVSAAASLFYHSIGLVQKQVVSGQISPGLQIPMSIPYFSLVLSFGIITLVQGITLIMMIVGKIEINDKKEKGEK